MTFKNKCSSKGCNNWIDFRGSSKIKFTFSSRKIFFIQYSIYSYGKLW